MPRNYFAFSSNTIIVANASYIILYTIIYKSVLQEKAAHGIAICVATCIIPVWVSVNIQEYRGKESEEE